MLWVRKKDKVEIEFFRGRLFSFKASQLKTLHKSMVF